MHMDPLLPSLVTATLAILVIGLLLRAMGQPHVVAYLLAGVLLGPHGFALVTDAVALSRLGAVGVVLLMFFIGMEVSPRELLRGWKVSVVGTACQIGLSVLCVWGVGLWRGWPMERVVLLGFIISLSSTAVVLSLLKDRDELHTPVGRNVLGVLLAQDVAIIPMLIVVGMMGGEGVDPAHMLRQGVGAVAVVALLAWTVVRETVRLPFAELLRKDHEMQVFSALVICFGLALLTGLLELSAALGAFVGGILVGSARETRWVHDHLAPFRVVFVALFFVSIGMLMDLGFLREHWPATGVLVLLVLGTNTVINALILRALDNPWRESLHAGAMLSQIGEFSFVLAAVGFQAKVIGAVGYQFAIAVITLSLFVSPAWIALSRRLMGTGGRGPVKTTDAT